MNHHTTPKQATQIADKMARAWATAPEDGLKYAILMVGQIEALVLLASGYDDETAPRHEGITDEAIDALCERVGPDKARRLCGIHEDHSVELTISR